MTGTYLAWAEYTIPVVIVVALLLITGIYSMTEKDSVQLTKAFKNICWLIIMVGIISTPAMLLSWTNVGSRVVEGLQGRYYLPLLPLIYFVFTKKVFVLQANQ